MGQAPVTTGVAGRLEFVYCFHRYSTPVPSSSTTVQVAVVAETLSSPWISNPTLLWRTMTWVALVPSAVDSVVDWTSPEKKASFVVAAATPGVAQANSHSSKRA